MEQVGKLFEPPLDPAHQLGSFAAFRELFDGVHVTFGQALDGLAISLEPPGAQPSRLSERVGNPRHRRHDDGNLARLTFVAHDLHDGGDALGAFERGPPELEYDHRNRKLYYKP